jgi:serine/threonine protein kinase
MGSWDPRGQKVVIVQIPSSGVIENRFELLGTLGAGGFGVVMEAKDLVFDREVAIKFLKLANGAEATVLARFQREAKILAQLEHENLVAIYSYGLYADRYPYIVMERAAGVRLRDLIISDGIQDFEMLRSIMIQVCEGLDYAHRRGVVHRDLTPANVCVLVKDDKASAKVIDFGLAHLLESSASSEGKLTGTGIVVGSVAYMSPEQCSGRSLDARSDIYSLGCILYECLSGSVPGPHQSNQVELKQRLQGLLSLMPESPSVRPQFAQHAVLLRAIVLRCLQKSRDDRFENCHEIVECLEKLQQPLPTQLSWSSRANVAEVSSNNNNRGLLVAFVVLMSLVFCLGLSSDAVISKVLSFGTPIFQSFEPTLQLNIAQLLGKSSYHDSSTICYKLIVSNSRFPANAKTAAFNDLAQVALDKGSVDSAAEYIQGSIKAQGALSTKPISEETRRLALRCLGQVSLRDLRITAEELFIRKTLLLQAARSRSPMWNDMFAAFQKRITPHSINTLSPQILIALADCDQQVLSECDYQPDKDCISKSKALIRQLTESGLLNEAAALLLAFDRWPALSIQMVENKSALLAWTNKLSPPSITALVNSLPDLSELQRAIPSDRLAESLIRIAIANALAGNDEKAKYYATSAVNVLRNIAADTTRSNRFAVVGELSRNCDAYLENGVAALEGSGNSKECQAMDAVVRTVQESHYLFEGKHNLNVIGFRAVTLAHCQGQTRGLAFL